MKLTIVLTLKDRVPFTYRWMSYMNDHLCPYKILIADGGADGAVEAHLRDHAHYPHLDYEYIRYPFDAVLQDFLIKLENVFSRVGTDYVLWADNDDFFLLDYIPGLLAFLEEHQDYVGVRGELVNLTIFDKAGLPSRMPKGTRYSASVHEAGSIEAPCPYDRVDILCHDMSTQDYYANMYCVFRAASFREVWAFLGTLQIRDMIVLEVLFHVLIVLRGKIAILPGLFYIRQRCSSMFGDTLVVGNTFLERCLENDSFSGFGRAVDFVVGQQSPENRSRLLKAIASWLEVFVSNIYWGRVVVRKAVFSRLHSAIKGVLLKWVGTAHLYYGLVDLFWWFRGRRCVRLKSVEAYIL